MDNLPDLDALRSFAVVARERNMGRAARILNICQPPLTRKIKKLEQELGLILLERNPKGVELTEAGRELLARVEPLLSLAEETAMSIGKIASCESSGIGLTTAFNQDVFTPYIEKLRPHCKGQLTRKESPKLARDVIKGRLACAFIALPLQTFSLAVYPVGHEEPLCAVLPESWLGLLPGAESAGETIHLSRLGKLPLFWFERTRNPAFYDHLQGLFSFHSFLPRFMAEPPEHDVLLARIAFGEGWALLPQSFSMVARPGIRFLRIAEDGFRLQLGFICREKTFAMKILRDCAQLIS